MTLLPCCDVNQKLVPVLSPRLLTAGPPVRTVSDLARLTLLHVAAEPGAWRVSDGQEARLFAFKRRPTMTSVPALDFLTSARFTGNVKYRFVISVDSQPRLRDVAAADTNVGAALADLSPAHWTS